MPGADIGPLGFVPVREDGLWPCKRCAINQYVSNQDEDISSAAQAAVMEREAPIFDIVNGFRNRCRGSIDVVQTTTILLLNDYNNLAEIIIHTSSVMRCIL